MLLAIPPSEPPAEAIVVTGKALPDPVAEKAYQVEIIGSRRLTNAPAHELDQILKRVSGLQLFRRSDSTSGHPTSQGVTLRALGGTASSRALLGRRRSGRGPDRGQNLFDETVTAALNDDGSVERATPRTVWLGLRFSSR